MQCHPLSQNLHESIKNEPFKIPEDDGNDLTHTFFNPDREGWLLKLGECCLQRAGAGLCLHTRPCTVGKVTSRKDMNAGSAPQGETCGDWRHAARSTVTCTCSPRFHARSGRPAFVSGPLGPLPSLPSGSQEGGQLCPSLLPITPPRPWRSCSPAPVHHQRLHPPPRQRAWQPRGPPRTPALALPLSSPLSHLHSSVTRDNKDVSLLPLPE